MRKGWGEALERKEEPKRVRACVRVAASEGGREREVVQLSEVSLEWVGRQSRGDSGEWRGARPPGELWPRRAKENPLDPFLLEQLRKKKPGGIN